MNRCLPVLVASLTLALGCTRPLPEQSRSDTKATEGAKPDPWETASRRLSQETDLAGCKAILGQLNTELAGRTDIPSPIPLNEENAKKLAAVVPLSAEDIREIRSASYSGGDAAYLAECFYLRDAARSLNTGGLSPVDHARIGFDWVCRQVYLHPWVIDGRGYVPAVPPMYILRRGYGSGLERAYAFLALLQQMGLEGCLIGPPDAENKPAGFAPKSADGKGLLTGLPKGPFWAVGVRVGADILLFEPWRGQPFPGPDGKSIGTLAQIRAKPEQLKTWFEDKTHPWGVTAEDVKKAAVFLTVPVSGLSPRLAMLQDKLAADTGLKLIFNPTETRNRFQAAAPNGPALPANEVKFWNPPDDRFAYGRVLSDFLPFEEGGQDRSEPGNRLFDLYVTAQVPRSVFVLPPELTQREVRERLIGAAFTIYRTAFLNPPTPLERIQRGQFQDAARTLTDQQRMFVKGIERLRQANPSQVAEFQERANEVYARLRAAQYPNPGQLQPQPDTDPAVVAARHEIDTFWRANAATVQGIVDQASARAGRLEATYLLALVKHEEAERQQLRADRATGPEAARIQSDAGHAWGEAANAWASYREQAGTQPGFPGRREHAKALADRAAKLAPKG